jgi:hypothetical protein
VSKEFLSQLGNLLEKLQHVEERWKDFWTLWKIAQENPSALYPSLPLKWRQFQEAFLQAALAREEVEKPLLSYQNPPPLDPTITEPLERCKTFFGNWVSGLMETQDPGRWIWKTGFDHEMEDLRFLILKITDAIKRHEGLLREEEARRLADRLRSPAQASASEEAAQASAAPSASPTETPKAGKPKRAVKKSKETTDSETLIISALCEHHKYSQEDIYTEPVGVRQLAEKLGLNKDTVSGFFKKHFRGYKGYLHTCRREEILRGALKMLRREYSPWLLLTQPENHEDDTKEEKTFGEE